MKNFQIILTAVFLAAGIFGILVFSGAIPIGGGGEDSGQGTVVIWGTIRSDILSPLVENFNSSGDKTYNIAYVEKRADTFDRDLLEALASGQGPDMFFLPDDLVLNYRNKIMPIPYTTYGQATFKQTFASAGEIFLGGDGVLAFPISIDPMVMYYNRSMLDSATIVSPPKTWNELQSMVPLLTKKDDTNKIIKSTVAFGQFSNITHAKDIISMLLMQTGNPIVSSDGNNLVSALDGNASFGNPSLVLDFYTSFANPLGTAYSWNKSFPNSIDYFSADNLAFYFGYASELSSLLSRNPNQNFLVTEVPQVSGLNFKSTNARVMGLAISRNSRNANTAFIALNEISSGDFARSLASSLGVVPARRDLIALRPTDQFAPTFYTSALYAKAWLDPSTKDTDMIFSRMIENILSNTYSSGDSVRDASSKLNLLLNR